FHGGDLLTRALIADGKTSDAVELSTGLVSFFPRLASAYLVHGFALAVAGDTVGATRQYRLAREVFRPPVRDSTEKYPQVDEHWYYSDQLVHTALEWGRNLEAVGLARALADIYPASARAQVTLGLALAQTGNVDGARAASARALQMDPRETRAIEWQRRLNR